MGVKKPSQFTRDEVLWILKYLSGYSSREIAKGAYIDAKTLDNGIAGTYQLSDEATRAVGKFLNVLTERLVEFPRKREDA